MAQVTDTTAVNKKIIPWGLHPMEQFVLTELKSRTKDYGMNPVEGSYSGPRTAWVRVFSNGISSRESAKVKEKGFVMGGTEGFDESYGFGSDKKITIGVDSEGNAHELDAVTTDSVNFEDDFPHRPPPSVSSVTCEFAGGAGNAFNALCRKTTVNWKCYSLNQLNYLIPYFLTPRISLVIEWGWNNYNKSSLIDLTDIPTLKKIWKDEGGSSMERIKKSNGNYDFAMGFIVDYGYRMAEDGGYECHTTIMNPNFLIEGQSYQESTIEKRNKDGDQIKMKDFIEFSNFNLEGFDTNNVKKKATVAKPMAPLGAGVGDSAFAVDTRTNPNEFIVDVKKSQVFSDNNDSWIRMDLVVDILNKFFERNFTDDKGNLINVGLTKLDITTQPVPVCAHPAIKSTNPNILIPNASAPRFANVADQSFKGEPPSNEYSLLFPSVGAVIKSYNYSEEYDNLQKVIGADQSFPIYDKDYNGGRVPKGYYGYLNDIYVSVKFLKEKIKENDTVLKLLESILNSISSAMCGIAQFKLITPQYNNSVYSIVDVNFSDVNTPETAKDLLQFDVNSSAGAFMRNGKFEIKISPDMMNQMIAVSAREKVDKSDLPRATYDSRYMKFDPTVVGDRIFDRAVSQNTGPSVSSQDNSKSKLTRTFHEENKSFYIYTNTVKESGASSATPFQTSQNYTAQAANTANSSGKIKQYILAETDSQFLKNVMIDIDDKRAIYTNNGVMLGTEFTAEFLGIAGITYLSQFTLDHVPSTYNYKNAVWQVSNVTQKIENKMWTTTMKAEARPLTILQANNPPRIRNTQ